MDKTQQHHQAAINSWEVALQFQFYSFQKWVGTRYFYLFFKLAGYLQKHVSSKLIDQMIDELQINKECLHDHLLGKKMGCCKQLSNS